MPLRKGQMHFYQCPRCGRNQCYRRRIGLKGEDGKRIISIYIVEHCRACQYDHILERL